MPTLQVNDEGAVLAYTDTGALKTPYNTIFLIHGFTFGRSNFRNLNAHAKEHNLRLVAISRRDYRGSTPLPADAFDHFKPGPNAAADLHAWFTERAKELSRFIVAFIKQEGIEGNIGVLGWSMGNQTSLSLLAYMDQLPAGEVEVLRKHLKVVYIFDTTFRFHTSIAPPVSDPYGPFTDPDIPDAERPAAFGLWVSSYFAHADIHSGDWTKLAYKEGRTDRKPTVTTYSAEDAAELMDPPAFREAALFQTGSAHPDEFSIKALIESSHLCPDVRIAVIYADSSIWECVTAPWILKEQIKKAEDAGGKARPTKYVEAKDANHFLLYDDPEQTIRLLAAEF